MTAHFIYQAIVICRISARGAKSRPSGPGFETHLGLLVFLYENEYRVLALGEETAVQAVVGTIVWAFRMLDKPKSRAR